MTAFLNNNYKTTTSGNVVQTTSIKFQDKFPTELTKSTTNDKELTSIPQQQTSIPQQQTSRSSCPIPSSSTTTSGNILETTSIKFQDKLSTELTKSTINDKELTSIPQQQTSTLLPPIPSSNTTTTSGNIVETTSIKCKHKFSTELTKSTTNDNELTSIPQQQTSRSSSPIPSSSTTTTSGNILETTSIKFQDKLSTELTKSTTNDKELTSIPQQQTSRSSCPIPSSSTTTTFGNIVETTSIKFQDKLSTELTKSTTNDKELTSIPQQQTSRSSCPIPSSSTTTTFGNIVESTSIKFQDKLSTELTKSTTNDKDLTSIPQQQTSRPSPLIPSSSTTTTSGNIVETTSIKCKHKLSTELTKSTTNDEELTSIPQQQNGDVGTFTQDKPNMQETGSVFIHDGRTRIIVPQNSYNVSSVKKTDMPGKKVEILYKSDAPGMSLKATNGNENYKNNLHEGLSSCNRSIWTRNNKAVSTKKKSLEETESILIRSTVRVKDTRRCCLSWCFCCSCSCIASKRRDSSADKTQEMSLLDQYFSREPPPTLEEIRCWGKSFEKLMKCSAGRKLFKEFLKCEYSEENILFWLACEDLKRESNPEVVEEKARLIYEDFISILSPKEVSLDSRVREIINNNMVEPTPHTFDEAQLQIYTLMHRDSYPRFVNSQMYRKLAQLPKPNQKGSVV
ncbi:uncharacterized protein LOC143236435 [Tachypleus tridentatus]|uniref:uncharacterized protein LOC143236435 n=1 Tax=Tachypleus tridentatus TaxID=6853 RepID=UPI003FD0D63E